MKPSMDANNEESNYYENLYNDNEADFKNNNITLDDEDGDIIIKDVPIQYDSFIISITVGYFIVSGRHAVFGFYRNIARPFKQGRNKLGNIFVLFAKVLDGTKYDQCIWVKCARVITNNTTNLICHL